VPTIAALLSPRAAAAGKNPSCPGNSVVTRAAQDCCIAVGRQRNGLALVGFSNRAGADQLGALLRPDTIAAGEDPRRASEVVIRGSADDRRVAVGRERNRGALSDALPSETYPARAHQLASLLGPSAVNAAENPRRTGGHAIARAANNGSVTIRRKGDGDALSRIPDGAAADQLGALLGPNTAGPGEHPGRSSFRVVALSSNNGGIAVSG
jgi:hypothetical protein